MIQLSILVWINLDVAFGEDHYVGVLPKNYSFRTVYWMFRIKQFNRFVSYTFLMPILVIAIYPALWKKLTNQNSFDHRSPLFIATDIDSLSSQLDSLIWIANDPKLIN